MLCFDAIRIQALPHNFMVKTILSMLTSLTRLPEDQLGGVLAMAAAALMVFVLAELLYIRIVKRAACREIRTLAVWEQRERSDNL